MFLLKRYRQNNTSSCAILSGASERAEMKKSLKERSLTPSEFSTKHELWTTTKWYSRDSSYGTEGETYITCQEDTGRPSSTLPGMYRAKQEWAPLYMMTRDKCS
jgi:hypothetical protein